MKTYAEKLKDPRWQRKRLEIMERDNFSCRHCRAKDKTLHVHHRIYLKGKQPWEAKQDHLVTLCEKCHEMAEERRSSVIASMGNNCRKDRIIDHIARTTSSERQESTFFQWAIESLATACSIHQALLCGEIQDPDGDASEECRTHLRECAESIYRAMFYTEEQSKPMDDDQ